MSNDGTDGLEASSQHGTVATHNNPTHVSHPASLHENFPNAWSRTRYALREPFAEFLGTLILVLFGNSVNCQVFLSMNPGVASSPRGDFLSLNFGWATGVAFGAWICGGISGGHINPAVTVALAAFRGFPWKKVPVYILAQMLGAVCGAAIAYANYHHAISIVEGGNTLRTIAKTGDLFGAYPLGFLPSLSCFLDEFIGSAVLMIGVLAVTDKKNIPPPTGLLPVALFILLLGIGTGMGMNTSYAANPARDLGPRILTAMVGYGREVFDFRHQYWLWCPLLAPVLGTLFGALAYDLLIYTGGDSIVNKPRTTGMGLDGSLEAQDKVGEILRQCV